MLGRRRRLHWLDSLWQLIWPRLGWRRAGTYYGHRMRRLSGTPSSIAAGFACGVAVSFTPLVGFHFVLAALISWLIGGNIIASAIGTMVGNPWTFPIIWLASYRLGAWLLGLDGVERASRPEGLSITYIFDNPEAVLLPMMAGGVLFALAAWGVSFWVVRRAVVRYQQLRAARIARRAARRASRRAERQAEPGAGGQAMASADGEARKP